MKIEVFLGMNAFFFMVLILSSSGFAAGNSDHLTYQQEEKFKKCLSEYNDSQLCTELAILTDRSLASAPSDESERAVKPKETKEN